MATPSKSKSKKKVKVADLKPAKDAKGGRIRRNPDAPSLDRPRPPRNAN